MTSLIVVCLCGLTMVTTSTSKVEDIFELEMDQRFGIQGCRKQCENRKACVDVKYSDITMTCVLKLNSSLKEKTGHGTGYCIKRSVRAKSGRIVTVCDLQEHLPREDHQIKYNGMKLGMFSRNRYDCKVTGKHGNIWEHRLRRSRLLKCRAILSQKFLRNGKYSWTVSVIQTDNLSTILTFMFKSVANGKLSSFFYVERKTDSFVFEKNGIYTKISGSLKFTLCNWTLNVKDFHKNLTLMTAKYGYLTGNELILVLKVKGKRSTTFRVVVTE